MSYVERLTQEGNNKEFDSNTKLIENAINQVIGENGKFPTLYNENSFTKLVRPMLCKYLRKVIENPDIDRSKAKEEFDNLIHRQEWSYEGRTNMVSAAADALKALDIQAKYYKALDERGAVKIGGAISFS